MFAKRIAQAVQSYNETILVTLSLAETLAELLLLWMCPAKPCSSVNRSKTTHRSPR